MRPIIGITMGVDYVQNICTLAVPYLKAVEKAGGVPVPLPPVSPEVPRYLSILDGLLMSGGGDPDPLPFGEEPRQSLGQIDPQRDYFETLLLREALEKDLPVLGICRGMQLLALVCGGELFQDYKETGGNLKHMQNAPRWHPTHSVAMAGGSRLENIYRCPERRVNSFHHQCVKRTGEVLEATAFARDGVIEGIESRTHSFALGVQWHPEALLLEDEAELALFQAFVRAAQNRRELRGSRGKEV